MGVSTAASPALEALRPLLLRPAVGGGNFLLIPDPSQPDGFRELQDFGPPRPEIPENFETMWDDGKEQLMNGPFVVRGAPQPDPNCATYVSVVLKRGPIQFAESCAPTRVCYEIVPKLVGTAGDGLGMQTPVAGASGGVTAPVFDFEVYQVAKGLRSQWELQQTCLRMFEVCRGVFPVPRKVTLISEECDPPVWFPLPPMPCISRRTLLSTFESRAQAEGFRQGLSAIGPCP